MGLTTMHFGALTLVALSVFPASAAWERHVIAAPANRIDHPQAHSLAFFTRYPLLRTEDPSAFGNCTPEQKLAKAKSTKATAEVSLAGKLSGFAIYDVIVHFEEDSASWKFILVKIGPNRYREIYHLEAGFMDEIKHSAVVRIGDRHILRSVDTVAGNGVATYQAYFWFDKDGPTWIDWTPIWNAARLAAPSDGRTMEKDWNSAKDLAHFFRVPIRGTNDYTCCSGSVDVKFVINHGRIQVVEAKYNPDAYR